MKNELLVENILKKISFKIQPEQNIRKEYFYRIKKAFYKLINKEKEYINSNGEEVSVPTTTPLTINST